MACYQGEGPLLPGRGGGGGTTVTGGRGHNT